MIDCQMFFSMLAALVVFRLLQAIPEFVGGVVRGFKDARKERLVNPAAAGYFKGPESYSDDAP